jgi:hypothetical protein
LLVVMTVDVVVSALSPRLLVLLRLLLLLLLLLVVAHQALNTQQISKVKPLPTSRKSTSTNESWSQMASRDLARI